MGSLTLIENAVRAGVWHGLLSADAADRPPPVIEVSHQGKVLPGISIGPVEGAGGRWVVSQPIPAEVLCDGVLTFLVREVGRDAALGHFTILTGEAIAQDMVAEIDLLRAELDMLKRAFRRHCLESGA